MCTVGALHFNIRVYCYKLSFKMCRKKDNLLFPSNKKMSVSRLQSRCNSGMTDSYTGVFNCPSFDFPA